MQTLEAVPSRLAEFGFKCNMDKYSFFRGEVFYLGYKIDKNGKQPNPKRVEPIINWTAASKVKEVERFIRKLNYYGKFLPNFSEHCVQLNRLRCESVTLHWSTEYQEAFDTLKRRMSEATKLVHFDSKLLIILATDGSNYGIGALLMHRYVCKWIRATNSSCIQIIDTSRENYSQIEKKAVAIIYGAKKFHQSLAGTKFELTTDHQPILTIFKPA